jgi:hypothetical protein
MSRRAYLHVGSPKTGTTFLQQLLWAQQDLARDQGLLLPLRGIHDHYLACMDLRGLSDRPHLPERAVGSWDRLVEAALGWQGNVLVSHELFAPATAEQAERAIGSFAPSFEVHVVLTARDLVRQIPAEWQQHLKSRAGVSLPEFIAGIRDDESRDRWFWWVQDFAGVARRWGGSLPATQVHVVTVPPDGSPPSILWERFATVLGLEAESFQREGFRSNTSLGAEQAELLRRVNLELGDRLPDPGPYQPVVTQMLAHRVLAGRRGHALTLEPLDREFAAGLSRTVAEDLKEMGVDIVGDLDDLMPPSEPPGAGASLGVGYDVTAEVLQAEGTAALAGVLDEYSTLSLAAGAKRRELRGLLDRARDDLAAARRTRSALNRRLDDMSATVGDLERRLADVQAERDRLVEDWHRRPVRHLLIGLSEHWRPLMGVRKAYWRLMSAVRTRLPGSGRRGRG